MDYTKYSSEEKIVGVKKNNVMIEYTKLEKERGGGEKGEGMG